MLWNPALNSSEHRTQNTSSVLQMLDHKHNYKTSGILSHRWRHRTVKVWQPSMSVPNFLPHWTCDLDFYLLVVPEESSVPGMFVHYFTISFNSCWHIAAVDWRTDRPALPLVGRQFPGIMCSSTLRHGFVNGRSLLCKAARELPEAVWKLAGLCTQFYLVFLYLVLTISASLQSVTELERFRRRLTIKSLRVVIHFNQL